MSTNHLMGVYNRAPLEVERGRGARLWSTDGTEYLDCVAGISTNGLGHAHPVLVQAVFYLVAGVIWIMPLKPLLRWMELGTWRR